MYRSGLRGVPAFTHVLYNAVIVTNNYLLFLSEPRGKRDLGVIMYIEVTGGTTKRRIATFWTAIVFFLWFWGLIAFLRWAISFNFLLFWASWTDRLTFCTSRFRCNGFAAFPIGWFAAKICKSRLDQYKGPDQEQYCCFCFHWSKIIKYAWDLQVLYIR